MVSHSPYQRFLTYARHALATSVVTPLALTIHFLTPLQDTVRVDQPLLQISLNASRHVEQQHSLQSDQHNDVRTQELVAHTHYYHSSDRTISVHASEQALLRTYALFHDLATRHDHHVLTGVHDDHHHGCGGDSHDYHSESIEDSSDAIEEHSPPYEDLFVFDGLISSGVTQGSASVKQSSDSVLLYSPHQYDSEYSSGHRDDYRGLSSQVDDQCQEMHRVGDGSYALYNSVFGPDSLALELLGDVIFTFRDDHEMNKPIT